MNDSSRTYWAESNAGNIYQITHMDRMPIDKVFSNYTIGIFNNIWHTIYQNRLLTVAEGEYNAAGDLYTTECRKLWAEE